MLHDRLHRLFGVLHPRRRHLLDGVNRAAEAAGFGDQLRLNGVLALRHSGRGEEREKDEQQAKQQELVIPARAGT